MSFSNTCQDLHNTRHFLINNTSILQSQTVRDLGIILSQDLKWSSQVQATFSKCNSLCFIILKTFKSKDPFFYLELFKLYVRPVIEYNKNTWMPSLVSDVKKIESIQANFTKRLCKKLNIKFHSYSHRLQILNLESLEVRGVKSDLILTYKILNQLLDLDQNTFFLINPCMSKYNLRRHDSHLRTKIIPNTTTRQNFFSHRIINIWNKLPNDTIKAKSLPIFKSKINCLDLSKFYSSKLWDFYAFFLSPFFLTDFPVHIGCENFVLYFFFSFFIVLSHLLFFFIYINSHYLLFHYFSYYFSMYSFCYLYVLLFTRTFYFHERTSQRGLLFLFRYPSLCWS